MMRHDEPPTGRTPTQRDSGRTIGRRTMLRGAAVLAAGALLPSGVWRDLASALASPARPGPGPYGPLGEPDALGIRLPAGFTARIVATTGQTVAGTSHVWHGAPDGGGCLAVEGGGWVYLSNAELPDQRGGVSALRFDADGAIADAYQVLSGTSRNCAGGITPWNTWLSCEEAGANGEVYECNPFEPGQGVVRPAMGRCNHEAAAVDPVTGHVYLTEDAPQGRLYKFVPDTPGDLASGQLYAASVTDGVVGWVPTSPDAPDRNPATTPFDGGEGIYHGDGVIWFATKGDSRVWELELATGRLAVAYDCKAHPSGSLTDVDNVVVHAATGGVFVAEDAGNMELGLLSQPVDPDDPDADRTMSIFLRVEGHTGSELTGMAFSPDGRRLYFSSQRGTDGSTGITYEVSGPFDEPTPPSPLVAETLVVSQMGWVRGGRHADEVMGGGPNQQICLNSTDTYSKRTFAAFDLSSFGDGSFVSAELSLSARVWRGDGEAVIEASDAAWDADQLTWNRQPAITSPVLGTFPLGVDRRRLTVDVTDHLNQLLADGATTASFGVRQITRNGPLGYVDGPGRPDEPTLVVVRSDAAPPPPPPPTTTPPGGVTTTIPIVRDSWVRGGSHADTNYASERLLQVCNNSSDQYARFAYVGIDLSAIGGAVRRATLRLNGRLWRGSDVAHDLLVVDDDWVDTDLTWATRPAPVGAAVASFSLLGPDPAWYELDVTLPVDAAHARGARGISFAIRQVTRNGPVAYFNPSNHWTDDRPELVVEHD